MRFTTEQPKLSHLITYNYDLQHKYHIRTKFCGMYVLRIDNFQNFCGFIFEKMFFHLVINCKA